MIDQQDVEVSKTKAFYLLQSMLSLTLDFTPYSMLPSPPFSCLSTMRLTTTPALTHRAQRFSSPSSSPGQLPNFIAALGWRSWGSFILLYNCPQAFFCIHSWITLWVRLRTPRGNSNFSSSMHQLWLEFPKFSIANWKMESWEDCVQKEVITRHYAEIKRSQRQAGARLAILQSLSPKNQLKGHLWIVKRIAEKLGGWI